MQYSKIRLRQKSLLICKGNTRSAKNFMTEVEEQGEYTMKLQCHHKARHFFIYHTQSDQSKVPRSGLAKRVSLKFRRKAKRRINTQPEHIWKCHGQVLMKCSIPVAQFARPAFFTINVFPAITCFHASFPLCDRELPYIKVLKTDKCLGPVFLTSAVIFPNASKVRYLQPSQLPSPLRRDQRTEDRTKNQPASPYVYA